MQVIRLLAYVLHGKKAGYSGGCCSKMGLIFSFGLRYRFRVASPVPLYGSAGLFRRVGLLPRIDLEPFN